MVFVFGRPNPKAVVRCNSSTVTCPYVSSTENHSGGTSEYFVWALEEERGYRRLNTSTRTYELCVKRQVELT